MNQPLVTIITPTFNHGHFIERCVKSVLRQTYPRWEMIVVDDASSDGTLEAVRGFASTSQQIQVIAHARRYGTEGLADTYNEALAASRGDLVALLDGDDWWTPDRLARQTPFFRDPSILLSYGDCWEVSADGRPIQYGATAISRHSVRSSGPEAIVHFSGLASISANTVLVRREALERIGGFRSEGLPLVDYPTWLELSLQGDFVRIPHPIAYWRRHPGSVYWRNMGRIAAGFHSLFMHFIQRHREAIELAHLKPETLKRNADEALARTVSSLAYFDAKYELLCGNRSRALQKLVRIVLDPRTSLHHRVAGLLGLGAGLSSRRLFFLALSLRRSQMPPRSTGDGDLLDLRRDRS